MQAKSELRWIVVCGKKEFVLSDSQIQVLKEADLAGQRGIVWFDKFAISIPHIEVMYVDYRRVDIADDRKFVEVVDSQGNIIYREVSPEQKPAKSETL